jgi:hypothetical protein
MQKTDAQFHALSYGDRPVDIDLSLWSLPRYTLLSLARENASAKALSDADWTMSTAMGSATVTKLHTKANPNSGKRQRPSSIGAFRPPIVAALSCPTCSRTASVSVSAAARRS